MEANGSKQAPEVKRLSDDFPDCLSRQVYGILGIPVDDVRGVDLLVAVETAIAASRRSLISTPNLNFLVTSQNDKAFRESLLLSDLCPPDGMPVVWIARFLGIPIRERAAGSDLFDALKSRPQSRPIRLFLFGGNDGVAETAAAKLNSQHRGVVCVGWIQPGFSSAESMSDDSIIDQINRSQADFLIVALGAEKGQRWLLLNHHRLHIPVRSHLGAVINFEAGRIKRAPTAFRITGTEWLWRIKEEPWLWRRYAHDGMHLLKLVASRILPLAIVVHLGSIRRLFPVAFAISALEDHPFLCVKLTGDATCQNIEEIIGFSRRALVIRKNIRIDMSAVRSVDLRFIGFLLVLRKLLVEREQNLTLDLLSPSVARFFNLSGFRYLIRDRCAQGPSGIQELG